ncbi:MAG: hypothetical protein EOO50_00170 [Flavobacterium sp.]|uniref:PH domain-containing protein n=1 Tax=Flavobacterium sp. TaxID=239 RepID=UPI0011F8F031|nr:PH domain-containing protein [Flavobacterium sp.]RZJ68630.1 MAG: hypothetical protein EOO50_00170 [Flavobacterium sp.]
MKKFSASLDKTALITTIGLFVVLMSVVAVIWLVPEGHENTGAKVYPTVIMLGVLAGAYLFSPRAFSIDEKGITVHRFWADVEIPFGKILSAKKIEKVSNKGLIRTLGNGGLFGYYGDFHNSEFGSMEWYLKRRRNIILIETATSKILISPDDVEDFLKNLPSNITLG